MTDDRCPECWDTGRISVTRTIAGHAHPFVAPCPRCPPSKTVTEAMANAEARRKASA